MRSGYEEGDIGSFRSADDALDQALFERVKAEQGHLNILVNRATALGPIHLHPRRSETRA